MVPEGAGTISVGEVAAPIKNALVGGPFGSDLGSSDYVPSGVPVIRGQNLSNGKFVGGEFVFVTEEKADKFKANLARPGDLVFTQRGNAVLHGGQVAIVPDRPFDRYLVSQSQMKLTPDRTKVDPRFLYFTFTSADYRHYLRSNAVVTGVPHINLRLLREYPLSLPPLPEQKAIAAVLGALDDKIELNRQMNATLEAMARALFQSWLVDFDPVHAKAEGRLPAGLDEPTAALFPAEFQDSELGEAPRGWRVGTLGEVATNPRRGVDADEISGATAYIGLEHMPRRCIALSEWDTAEDLESNKSEFKQGEILFGKLRPYFHKVGIAPLNGVCSTDILVIRPAEPDWFGFVLGHISSIELVNHTDAMSTGTKMPRTKWKDIADFDVVLPSPAIAAAFTRLVEPAVQRIIANIHQTRTLATLRDTLLPKLLSGDLKV